MGVRRVVQGAFGGGLLATAQSILRDTFQTKTKNKPKGINPKICKQIV